MTAYTTWRQNILDNPVARREATTLGRGRSKWFWRGAMGLTVMLSILPLLNNFAPWFHQTLSTATGLLIFANVAVFGAVVLRTITVATDSVVRERRGQTWELLMLTGSGVGRIVLGKWLGTMRFMLRDYAWLFIVRAVLYFWMLASNSLRNWDWRDIHNTTLANVTIDAESLIIGLMIVAIFGFLELMLSSALGLATAFFPWSQRAGVWLALVARIGLAIAFALGIGYLTGIIRPYPYHVDYPETTEQFLLTFLITLGDNGAVSTAMLMVDGYWRPGAYIALGLLAAVPVYLMFIGAGLGIAHYTAYRQGANVGSVALKTKPKRAYTLTDTKLESEKTAVPEPKTAVSSAGATNIFALPNAEQYRVEIFHYQRHLSRLLLRATSERETVYLQFSGVAHLDVPSAWHNANFCVGTSAALHQMLQTTGTIANSVTADALRLYIVTSADKPLKIIATTAVLLRELSESIA